MKIGKNFFARICKKNESDFLKKVFTTGQNLIKIATKN